MDLVYICVLQPVMGYVSASVDRIDVVPAAVVCEGLMSGMVAVCLCLGKMTDLPLETPTNHHKQTRNCIATTLLHGSM